MKVAEVEQQEQMWPTPRKNHDNDAVTRNGESSTQEVFGNGSSISGESTWWHVEPDVGRVAHGIPAGIQT